MCTKTMHRVALQHCSGGSRNFRGPGGGLRLRKFFNNCPRLFEREVPLWNRNFLSQKLKISTTPTMDLTSIISLNLQLVTHV